MSTELFFNSANKPQLPQAVTHSLLDRIYTGSRPAIWNKERLDNGDVLFTSSSVQEHNPLTDEMTPLAVRVTPEGQQAFPTEESLYKVLLPDQTSHIPAGFNGKQSSHFLYSHPSGDQYVVKYPLPTRHKSGSNMWTSGKDEMELLQLAQQELGWLDIQFVQPIIATHNIVVTPYIENGVNYLTFIDELKDKLSTGTATESLPQPWVLNLAEETVRTLLNYTVRPWTQKTLDSKYGTFFTGNLFPDVELYNLIVNAQSTLTELLNLSDKYSPGSELKQEDTQQFQRLFMRQLKVIELTTGFEP